MVSLLTLIMQQSLKIEKARNYAENKLFDSMEKYKTLVQATTEGLIMIIDNEIIFTNTRIQQMTGYDIEELTGHSFLFLLDKSNAVGILNIFKEDTLADGKFEVILKTKDDQCKEVLLTVSSISISEKNGKIIIIKDISTNDKNNLVSEDYQQLINNFNLGFIRLLLDAKGRILTSNDTTARIFGYDTVAELTNVYFLDCFSIPEYGTSFRNTLIKQGSIRDEHLVLRKKDGSEIIVSISLLVTNNENEQLVCEGLIEDVTIKVRKIIETEKMIAEMKTSALFMQQPIARYARHLVSIDMNDSVSKAEKIMSVKKTDVLSVVTENNEIIGVLTFSDIRERVVFKGIRPEIKVFEIMSSPIISIDSNASISDAILLTSDKNIDHLVVNNDEDLISRVLHTKDIPNAFCQSQFYIESQIRTAGSTDEMKFLFSKIITIARPLIEQDIQAQSTGRLIGSISGLITNRIIELAIDDIGTPPVDFVFIVLGSEGRLEQTLETDQDNAIIFRDVPENDELYIQNYFSRLSNKVCDCLNAVGFNYCKGMVMAKNPRWCMPLKTWKNYFSGWINTPEPQNLLDISIFFDFRPVAGNFDLAHDLRTHINHVIQDKPSFFYNLADQVINFKPALGFTGNIITEKRDNRDLFDLKNAITPVVMFARFYALFKNINKTNTVDRLTALNKEQVISNNDFHEILFGYNFLMRLRYKHQVHMIKNNLEPDNRIDIRELADIEISIIKKIFSSVSIVQTMLSNEFKKTI
jgi:PAS domain S-box-containing protein